MFIFTFKKGERDTVYDKRKKYYTRTFTLSKYYRYTYIIHVSKIYIYKHTHLFTCNSIVKVLLIVNKFEIIIYTAVLR